MRLVDVKAISGRRDVPSFWPAGFGPGRGVGLGVLAATIVVGGGFVGAVGRLADSMVAWSLLSSVTISSESSSSQVLMNVLRESMSVLTLVVVATRRARSAMVLGSGNVWMRDVEWGSRMRAV